MMFGMLGGLDTMGTTAILLVRFAVPMAERRAYQSLCLAMVLGFAWHWLPACAASAGDRVGDVGRPVDSDDAHP